VPENVEIAPEHRPDFLEKFIRLNRLMWTINGALTEEHPFESRPHEWPLLLSGIVFWNNDNAQILLLGNPLVFWSSTVAVLTFFLIYGFFQLRDKRGCKDSFGGLRQFYEASAGFFALGWALHYVPFFLMKRQLFLHHYMPALYFAVLTLGVGMDLILRRFPRILKVFVFLTAAACMIYTYWVYSPLAYGENWTVAECENAFLLKTWDLNCARYAPLGSPERLTLGEEDEEEDVTATKTITTPDEIVYVDEEGNRMALEDVPPEYLDNPDYVEEEEGVLASETVDLLNEDIQEAEEYNDEEDLYDAPTEAPEPPVYEPEFIDGKEVFVDDDEDEDEWPKTVYGIDPEADEDEVPKPVTTREILATRYLDL
jgi:dolichyl-phosphate-mannose-protein mannosyltransferase